MNRLSAILALGLLCPSLAALAQDYGTGFTTDGYYRVRNVATGRYIYVTDNKDYYSAEREDFQAIQLWKDAASAADGKSPISSPASVIYIRQVGSKFDLTSQGTGVHALTGYYVSVDKKSNGTYEVSASVSSSGVEVTKYLSDTEKSSTGQGCMGTTGTLNYRRWAVDRIETTHATNYVGITPTLEAKGKYYQPFYAAFPFKPASEGMHVYYICLVDSEYAVLREIEGEVPAATPVIVECSSSDPSQNRLELLTASSGSVSGNKLQGVYFCNGKRRQESVDAYRKFDATSMRVLSQDADGKLVFTSSTESGLEKVKVTDYETLTKITAFCIPANHSFLRCDATTAAELTVLTEEEYKGVGIEDLVAESDRKGVRGVFTLSGQMLRETNDTRGLPAGVYVVGEHTITIQ